MSKFYRDDVLYILKHTFSDKNVVPLKYESPGSEADEAMILILASGGLSIYDGRGDFVDHRQGPVSSRASVPRLITDEYNYIAADDGGCTLFCASRTDLRRLEADELRLSPAQVTNRTGLAFLVTGAMTVAGENVEGPSMVALDGSGVALSDAWLIVFTGRGFDEPT